MSNTQIHGAVRVASATLTFPSGKHRQEWAKETDHLPEEVRRLPPGEYSIAWTQHAAMVWNGPGSGSSWNGYMCTNLGRIVSWFTFGSNGPLRGAPGLVIDAQTLLTLEQCELMRMTGKIPAIVHIQQGGNGSSSDSVCRELWPKMIEMFRTYTTCVMEPIEVVLQREQARL